LKIILKIAVVIGLLVRLVIEDFVLHFELTVGVVVSPADRSLSFGGGVRVNHNCLGPSVLVTDQVTTHA